MENIEKYAQSICTEIEKYEVRDKLKKEFDVVSRTIGCLELYQTNGRIGLLSNSTLGNKYLSKVSQKDTKEKNLDDILLIIKRKIKNYEDKLEAADMLEDFEDLIEKAEHGDLKSNHIKNFLSDLKKEDKKLAKKFNSILDDEVDSDEVASILKKMKKNHEDVLYDADLLDEVEDLYDEADDGNVDIEELKNLVKSVEDDKDCKKETKRLLKKLKALLPDGGNKENFNLADILFNNRFRYINTIDRNLIAINLELSKINSLGFFLTLAINERDFILIKPYSYSDIERLFFIGVDKFKENIYCPVCENEKRFSQYIKTSSKLVTVCNECSHIINLKEEF